MRKIISLLLITAFFISLSSNISAEFSYYKNISLPQGISAEGVYIVDLGADVLSTDDNTVLYSKNYTSAFFPASLTKIMTAIIVIEKYSTQQELEAETQTMTEQINVTVLRANASNAGIKVGETLNLKDLLYCLLLPSGADAALMLADHVSDGKIENFVTLMNNKAHAIGAESTFFTNVHGLHDDSQVTTIANVERITKYALYTMNNSALFRTIVGSAEYTLPQTDMQNQRKIYNTNKLLRPDSPYYTEGVTGVKTGNTDKAGQCLISTCNKNGFNLFAVVMKSADNINGPNSFTDTKALYDWVFNTYAITNVCNYINPVLKAKVNQAVKGSETVDLIINEDILRIVPKSATGSITVVPKEDVTTLKAPLTRGQAVAKADIKLEDNILATVDLIVKEDIKRDFKYMIYDYLIYIAIAAVSLLIALIIIIALIRKNRPRRSGRYF